MTLAVLGCEQSGIPVNGTVTFGGQPLPSGTIAFVGPDGGSGVYGGTIRDGKYAVDADRKVRPGKYAVQISWMKPTGKSVAGGEGGTASAEVAEAIPDRYNLATQLTAEVRTGSGPIDFALEK